MFGEGIRRLCKQGRAWGGGGEQQVEGGKEREEEEEEKGSKWVEGWGYLSRGPPHCLLTSLLSLIPKIRAHHSIIVQVRKKAIDKGAFTS